MKLSKERALRICRELWIWMYEKKKASDKDKELWPGWRKHGRMLHECPVCQYHNQQGMRKVGCMWHCANVCLLNGLWPDGCVHSNSPYSPFTDHSGVPADSLKTIRGCEAALRKMHKKVVVYKPRSRKKAG